MTPSSSISMLALRRTRSWRIDELSPERQARTGAAGTMALLISLLAIALFYSFFVS